MENKLIFLHSMFRAGSTYMFDKFRSYDDFYTYYEPLHHDLIRLRKNSIDIWKYHKEAAKAMNHPKLKKPHFYEFQTAFKKDGEGLPFFDSDFSYKEFFKVQQGEKLKKYIDNIINTTPKEKIPLLQFNRTSARIDWFKDHYPASFNVFLLRNPKDQFESYMQRGDIGKNIFLAINMYIALTNKKFMGEIFDKKINFKPSDRQNSDLAKCMKLSKKISLLDHYKIFYFIWIHSLLHAKKYADLVIDMDKINTDTTYLLDIKDRLLKEFGVDLDFSDYKIKTNNAISLSMKSIEKIEKNINDQFEIEIEKSTINLEEYMKKYTHFELKKIGLLSAIIKKIVTFAR